MKKIRWIAAGLMALSSLALVAGCGAGQDANDSYQDYDGNKPAGDDQFDFGGNYTPPELVMDGKGEDAEWVAVQDQPIARFGRNNAVTVWAYRGENALFFLFDVKDNVLLTWGETNDDAVTHSDSIEVFIDTKADGGSDPQSDDIQLNLGIHGKTRIMRGSGSSWGGWNGLIDYAVDLKGTLNDGEAETDEGYSVEVMIPYKDIMIQKDDTIGISFGQVDKRKEADAPTGSPSGEPWNWYGWEFNGQFVNPQKPDQYVQLNKDNRLYFRGEEPSENAGIAGTVKDSEGAPIEGANVSVAGMEKTAVTDSAGKFLFADMTPMTYEVLITKEGGYYDTTITYTSEELRAANGGTVTKDITLYTEATAPKCTVTGTVKNVALGAIGDATVSVKGMNGVVAVQSGSDGVFTLENVPQNATDITLVVTKRGFADSETKISKAVLNGAAVSAGDVNLSLPAGDTGKFATGSGKQNDKQSMFVNANAEITRTLTGINFEFTGTRALSGRIEMYLDTKASTGDRDQETSAWRFDLNDNGAIGGTHFAGGSFVTKGLEYHVHENSEGGGYKATFFIPYSYLGIAPTEVIGLSFGQFSVAANDWDGWHYAGEFVAPEKTPGYLRFGPAHNFYRADNNEDRVLLSGNAGQAGVTVKVGSDTVKTDAQGDWSMIVLQRESSVEYSKAGYVKKTEALSLNGKFVLSLGNVTLDEFRITVSGTVTGQENGAGLEGVEVTLTYGDNGVIKTTTDANGAYSFANVTTFTDIKLTFALNGYVTAETAVTQETLLNQTQAAYTADKALVASASVVTITLNGKVVGIEGGLAGASVKLGEEVIATSDENGVFTAENFKKVDCKLTVSKGGGYMDTEVQFSAEQGAIEADIFLKRNYEALGPAFGTKNENFASFVPYVTRGQNAFEFKFVGSKAFSGRIELFVDTKGSSQGVNQGAAADFKRNETDYLFNLNDNGEFTIVNWNGGGNENTSSFAPLAIRGTETEPVVLFSIPYAFLKVTATEIIGVSFGQWSNSASDWDGWNYPAMPGFNGGGFVAPEITMDYIRIGVDNKPFENSYNYEKEKLDLSGYQIHFAQKGDSFYSKVVSRDATGVTFEFVTLGDFAKRGEANEMVFLYFNTGANNTVAWAVDYMIKIGSDGVVYGRRGNGSDSSAFFEAVDADKTGETVNITRENGVTRFTYKVTYERLGIGETDVFGVAMREGTKNVNTSGDKNDKLIDPWYDCYFEETHHVDAAWTTGYIRVKADGTLVLADSNAAVN